MPHRKVQMSLIGNARARATTFKARKKGLMKKAEELAALCDIDVAVVCAGPGGGAPDVWESKPGAVIDRYLKLPAEKRTQHTHVDYLDGQLSKEKERLAKVRRQGLRALACPSEAVLKDVKLEELLASIDAALLATAERRKALGVADDDDGRLGQVPSDAIVPVGQGGAPFACDDLDDMEAWIQELTWDGVQPLPLNTSMAMAQPAPGVQYISGDNVNMPPGNSCPDYGFQRTDSICAGMDEYSQMPVPRNANAYGDGWFSQPLWGAREPSCDAVVPVEYYPSLDIAGNPVCVPPEHEHPGMGIDRFMDAGGHEYPLWRADEPPCNAVVPVEYYPSLDIAGNPVCMPPEHGQTSMGINSFMDAGGHEYETGYLADYFQRPVDANQHYGAEPLHYYLGDMDEGIRYSDLGVGSCSSGTTRFFPCSQGHGSSGTLQISGSEQYQRDVRNQYQDPGIQHFWVMEEPPVSTAVATAGEGETWANLGSAWHGNGGLGQSWMPVQQ